MNIFARTSLWLLPAAACLVFATAADAQSNTTLSLNYNGPGPCKFVTDSGVNIDGSTGLASATGHFDASSNCPTGSGTGPAAVTTLTASPGSVAVNQPVTVNWSAVGDVCRYDGSILPAAVAGWATSGDACIGAAECASPHALSMTPTTGGTYKLMLTCTTGASGNAARTTAAKNVNVEVSGGTPPSGQCVAPSGLTRSTSAAIMRSGGQNSHTADVTSWQAVFGTDFSTGQTFGWPGQVNSDVKFNVVKNQYWALQFTVGPNYPYFNASTNFPYGTFNANDTNTTPGMVWTLSISEDCGDFSPPPASDPRSACFAQYTNMTSSGLLWKVMPNGVNAQGACTLRRGHTYYFNVLGAALGTPTISTCTGSSCRINIQHVGSYQGTQGQ